MPDSTQTAIASADPAPRTDRPRARRAWTAEVVLTALVLAFAFLAASFVARNADFWLDLAAGRLVAQGAYPFGADPFAYTTAGVAWINHAWLYDRIVYLLYREGADAWLVVLKATMIAGVAVLLLMIRRPGKPGWLPAFFTALAVLVMSPWLLLQPRCVSVVLLGLTLWLLWSRRAPARPLAWRPVVFQCEIDARALLIPLCALWVNLDDWFLLGPLLAGLFWVGDRIQPLAARPRGMRPTPAWLPLLCLAACLCSPYHVFGFTLPADLSMSFFSGGLFQDVRFRPLAASPWQFDAALRSPAGANVAGLAYFVLVALGVASFAVNRSGLRDWRILAWVVFALLGVLSVRLIPFFAVVGGPVAALNWQGMKYEAPARVVVGLRAACVVFLAALIALAVPGWLHGFGRTTMPVAWGVEINPSLRRAAETLHRWRASGRLGAGERSFCMHPDAACYCAWFCPDEKSFLDARFNLFSGAANDYAAVCEGLDPSLTLGRKSEEADWRNILRGRGVAAVVLYDPDPKHVLPVLGRMYESPDEWTILSIDGEATVVGWNPARPDRFADLRFDPARLVFEAAEDEAPAAPGRGPGRDPRPPDWTSRLGRQPIRSWESTASRVDLTLFEDPDAPGRKAAEDRGYLTGGGGFSGLMGLPAADGTPGGPLGRLAPILFRVAAVQEVLPSFRDRPPDLALLAVRAARRAVAANPDDARAYLQLALAYLALRNETAEHSRAGGLTPLAMLRHVQIVTALRQALVLDPDMEAAHQLLADQFLQMRPIPYIDVALRHRQAQARLVRRGGRGSDETADAFQRRLDGLEAQVGDLEKVVQDAANTCEIRFKSLGDDPVKRAVAALRLGLADKALDDVLRKARVDVYGTEVARRQLELLILTGESREAQDVLGDEEMRANRYKLLTYEVSFGDTDAGVAYKFPTYEWLLACASGADGDYEQADAALEVIGKLLEAEGPAGGASYAASVASDVGAPAAPTNPLAVCWAINRGKMTSMLYLNADRDLRVERAGLLTLRALLDLERGAPEDARMRLKGSLDLSGPVRDAGGDVPGAALAGEYWKRFAAGD